VPDLAVVLLGSLDCSAASRNSERRCNALSPLSQL
jgi:hypothetical protein